MAVTVHRTQYLSIFINLTSKKKQTEKQNRLNVKTETTSDVNPFSGSSEISPPVNLTYGRKKQAIPTNSGADATQTLDGSVKAKPFEDTF